MVTKLNELLYKASNESGCLCALLMSQTTHLKARYPLESMLSNANTHETLIPLRGCGETKFLRCSGDVTFGCIYANHSQNSARFTPILSPYCVNIMFQPYSALYFVKAEQNVTDMGMGEMAAPKTSVARTKNDLKMHSNSCYT
jgi:hypothetical protein